MRKNLSPLTSLWILNLILLLSYVLGLPGAELFKSSVLEYSNITSDPFDGAVSPIAYVPDWTKSANTNKSKRFEDFAVSDFVEIPEYDTTVLSDDSGKKSSAILTRYTYPVVYMGSYRGNYAEYDGSHLAVDIRAPIGTPILAVANGVVTKVKNDEGGDGKYVVLRHDNIDSDGTKQTYYSIYQHMEDAIATEGTKVKRGDVIGKVGMTGITTTPHVHFQIDKSDAPFHGYWPYTFREATDLGLDFFSAINVGLGKENAIRYTINPMEFIKNHRFYAAAPTETQVVVGSNTEKPNDIADATSTLVADASTTPTGATVVLTGQTNTETVSSEVLSNTSSDPTPLTTPSSPVRQIDPEVPFSDIAKSSDFYRATKYLADKNVTHGYEDGTFRVNNELTRKEAILLYARLFSIPQKDDADWEFTDILPSDEVHGYLASAVTDGIIAKNAKFRPNDSLTRAEAITLLIRIAKIAPVTGMQIFEDVKSTSTHAPHINAFARYMGLKGGAFGPNRDITRGELAKILYLFDQKKK